MILICYNEVMTNLRQCEFPKDVMTTL